MANRLRIGPSGPVVTLLIEEGIVPNGSAGVADPDVTLDWSQSNNQSLLLTSPTTVIRQTGLPTGECAHLTLNLFQDASGNRHVAFADCITPGGAGLTLSTAANARDQINLFWDGHVLQAVVAGLAFS